MKQPYDVLGLSENASESELKNEYNRLKQLYGEQRFMDGEAGNEGARKLAELEDAWLLISADIKKRNDNRSYGNDFGIVDKLIKEGKLEEAQAQLDQMVSRPAEWNYFQSIIYYKREWLSESRAQLVIAVSLEPNNKKYTDALERLDAVMANPHMSQESFNPGGYAQQQNRQGDMLCRCCQAYLCMDCCCSLMQCCR